MSEALWFTSHPSYALSFSFHKNSCFVLAEQQKMSKTANKEQMIQ